MLNQLDRGLSGVGVQERERLDVGIYGLMHRSLFYLTEIQHPYQESLPEQPSSLNAESNQVNDEMLLLLTTYQLSCLGLIGKGLDGIEQIVQGDCPIGEDAGLSTVIGSIERIEGIMDTLPALLPLTVGTRTIDKAVLDHLDHLPTRIAVENAYLTMVTGDPRYTTSRHRPSLENGCSADEVSATKEEWESIMHDLKNPFQTFILAAPFLQEEHLREKGLDFMRNGISSCRATLARSAERFLHEYSPTEIDRRTIEKILSRESLLLENQIEIVLEFEEELSTFSGSVDALVVLIQNLIQNGERYLLPLIQNQSDGTGNDSDYPLRMKFTFMRNGVFTYQDNGPGIPGDAVDSKGRFVANGKGSHEHSKRKGLAGLTKDLEKHGGMMRVQESEVEYSWMLRTQFPQDGQS